MTSRYWRIALLLACCSLLTACSQWYYDLGTSLSRADTPNPADKPAMAEVLDQLGPPTRMSATVNGYVMAWEHWYITEESLCIRLGVAGVDFMSLDWGTSNAQGEFLVLSFNREHQLLDASFMEFNNKAGGGQGIQPMLGFVDVVDVDDLLRRMPQHDWGAGSLEQLPITLNSDNRPDTGQNGLEQRGTPTSVGQRSLEEN